MKKLHRLVDLAALLSLTATTPEARFLAARKRVEALQAIARAEKRLAHYRVVLAMFPPVESVEKREVIADGR